jgi:hypothetical protein
MQIFCQLIKKNMKIQTIRFVSLDEVFEGFSNIEEVFHDNSSDYDFTWGCNNHTMIDVETFISTIEEIEKNILEDEEVTDINNYQFKLFFNKLRSLPNDVYINLESSV